MGRIHLFEFEDQPWFPSIIRDAMTDFLKFVANRFDFYESVVPIIEKGVAKSGANTIVDLASGAGGGWEQLGQHLAESCPDLKVILTDRYLNQAALTDLVESNTGLYSFEPKPIDARDVPNSLKGLRTQFLSFHHFKPSDATQILQNAVDAGQPIAIFEAQKRDVAHFIKFAMSPIAVLLMTPLIRPVKFSRLLLTYLLPLIPAFTFWDGLVSVLRTYSAHELQELTESLESGNSYEWEIGESKSGSVTVPYLLGYSRRT